MATITGTDASDFLVGTDDGDLINGGLGNDTIRGLGGNDTLNGAEGNDSLDGGDGNDLLIGGAGDDTIQGGRGADTIEGTSGNNVLRGGKGHDSITGGTGNDTIYSGYGQDTLTGNGGTNVFVLKGKQDAENPSAIVAPTITDFVAGTDTIAIEGVTADEITTALAAQETVEGGVSFKIGDGTIVVKGAGLTSLTSANVTTEAGIPSTPGAGQSYSLTTGVDNITGDSSDNKFDASRAVLSGQTVNTLNNADRVDGNGGVNTLFVQMHENLGITPASVKNIQTLEVENTSGFAQTLNMVNGDDKLSKVVVANSSAAVTVNNLRAAVSEVELTNVAVNTTITGIGLGGASDEVTVTMSGHTAGTVVIGPGAAGSGYETMNIVSKGSLTNVATIGDGVGNSLTTVNVSGDRAATLTLSDATVTTVNAGNFTAALTLNVDGGNTQNMAITGGSGNDVINMAGTYTSNDTINGGDGNDRLTLTNAEAIVTTKQTNVSNIEVIGLSDGINGTVDLTNFSATGIRFGANMAGASTVSYAAGTNSLDLQTFASGGSNLTVNVAGVAVDDVLNVTLGSTAAGNTFGAGNVTINGAETVNITSQGGANSFVGTFSITDTAATQAIVITGNQNITFTGAVRADSINASGMTGTGTLTLTGGTGTTATTITGTGNADTLIGSTAGDIINGGAGNDTISNAVTGTAASAGDVLTGGAGNDQFQLYGDTASGAVATILNTTSYITDFNVGTSGSTDVLALSATVGNYANVSAFTAGVAVAAAGATAIQSVAQNAGATGLVAGVDLLKFTTGVATAGQTLQQAFDAAIGTATITGAGAGNDVFFAIFDTTNGRMLVGAVDSTAGVDGTIEAGDTVSLIGSIAMTSADYANFSNTHFAIIA